VGSWLTQVHLEKMAVKTECVCGVATSVAVLKWKVRKLRSQILLCACATICCFPGWTYYSKAGNGDGVHTFVSWCCC